jgi:amino acid adenylation domain-containing protein
MEYLLHHLLVNSAERSPDKAAVRFGDQTLTYEQLDKLTNQVARALRSVGVRRGHRVGIYLHKSLASVISVFGILKAGGVYVPLDPNAPVKRLAYIAQNCNIRVLLSASNKLPAIKSFFEEGSALESLLLADDADEQQIQIPDLESIIASKNICAESDEPLPPDRAIETDLAYILYTSGSTGEPKGVMISHRTIFTFINWCFDAFQMTKDDRVTSHAPLHFDLSTFDIYVTVKAGGTIIIIPEKVSIFPEQLVRLLQEERVTVTYLVPSILSLMVNYGNLASYDLRALRAILFAGEVFPIKYLRQLVAAIPHADCYNLYGPTETNVCTYYKVQPRDLDPARTQPVPIGIACENMDIFVVDNQGQLVTKPGVEGELWVRGSCVAQGYWGDPDKTAERFVTNPLQTQFEEKAYRTGDIVTLDEDSVNWIFIGRRDHMIKSRGYRIELGEIESVLYSFPGVMEAAVVAIPDDLIGHRVRAFVVSREENKGSLEDLREHCYKLLPTYMVPERFTFLNELPKTSTGKINRPLLSQS